MECIVDVYILLRTFDNIEETAMRVNVELKTLSASMTLLVTLLLCLSACEEVSDMSPVSNTNIQALQKPGDFTPPGVTFNSLNPCDSVGLLHNAAIAYAINHLWDSTTVNDVDVYWDSVATRAAEYFVSIGSFDAGDVDQIVFDGQEKMESPEYAEVFADEDYMSDFTNDSLTALEIYYIQRIGAVVEDSTNSYSTIIDSLNEIENDIVLVNWSDGQYSACITISIAKYSFRLWKSLSTQVINCGGSGLSDENIRLCARSDVRSYLRDTLDANGDVIGHERIYEIVLSSLARPVVTTANVLWDALCSAWNWLFGWL